MSITGIFLLLYLSHQRLWAVIYRDKAGKDILLVAGSGNRNVTDFKNTFTELMDKLDRLIGGSKNVNTAE